MRPKVRVLYPRPVSKVIPPNFVFHMKKAFFWIYCAAFINVLGSGMVAPLFPTLASHLRTSPEILGIVASVSALLQFFVAPILGNYSDVHGRKNPLIFMLLMSSIGVFLIGVADVLWVFILGMLFFGFGGPAVLPIALAYVSDITSKSERGKYISKVTAMFALGFMISPAIGGLLGNGHLEFPFYAASIITLLNAILIFLFLPESLSKREQKSERKKQILHISTLIHGLKGEMGVIFFLAFLWALYVSNYSFVIPFYTHLKYGFGDVQNGLLYSGVGLVAAVTQWVAFPAMSKKLLDLKPVFLGLIFLIVGLVSISFAPVTLIFLPFFALTVFGSATIRPGITTILSKRVKDGQGITMGIASSFESLGRIIGPILFGFQFTNFHPATPFLTSAALLAVGLFLFWKVELKPKK